MINEYRRLSYGASVILMAEKSACNSCSEKNNKASFVRCLVLGAEQSTPSQQQAEISASVS
jgi:hypothetical protein